MVTLFPLKVEVKFNSMARDCIRLSTIALSPVLITKALMSRPTSTLLFSIKEEAYSYKDRDKTNAV